MSVLLDEWVIRSAVYDGLTSWNANEALRTFEDAIVRGRRLAPVRFVSEGEYANMIVAVGTVRSPRTKQNLLRLLPQFVRTEEPSEIAQVPDAPRDLSVAWLQALAATVEESGDDWRRPQIVYPLVRRDQWPLTHEIDGTCAGQPFQRVLAQIERYDEHRYACSDWDPWDQRHLHLPTPGRDEGKPRLLPKPPPLIGLAPRALASALEAARQFQRESSDGRWFYVPARGWEPLSVGREPWRAGAFPLGQLNGRSGCLDIFDRVWHWDPLERHWDVQVNDRGAYQRVSHDGSML